MPRGGPSGGPFHRAVVGVLALCLLCLLVLAVGYVQLRRQVVEQQQELALMRQRAEADHAKLWRDELYIPYLEQRLTAAHEKGTPAEWRALVMQQEGEKRKEQEARRAAGMEQFMQRLEKRNQARNGGGGR